MPPIPIILGYSEAAQFLRSPDAAKVVAIISIRGNLEFGVESSIETRLDLTFDDAPSPDNPDVFASYHARQYLQVERENGRELHPPTPSDAQAIIDFSLRVRGLSGILLCHCLGGISRSPAAAALCMAAWTEPCDEPRVAKLLRELRPCAQPHPDLVRFGDQILKRHGQLQAAMQT